jgi:hypothetical protein
MDIHQWHPRPLSPRGTLSNRLTLHHIPISPRVQPIMEVPKDMPRTIHTQTTLPSIIITPNPINRSISIRGNLQQIIPKLQYSKLKRKVNLSRRVYCAIPAQKHQVMVDQLNSEIPPITLSQKCSCKKWPRVQNQQLALHLNGNFDDRSKLIGLRIPISNLRQ